MATRNTFEPTLAQIFGNMEPVGRATVTLGFGRVNFKNSSATYAAMKVTAPFNRATAITSGTRAGQQTVTQAGTWSGNGALLSVPVMHSLGTVIELQVKHMRGPSVIRDGALFLRLRVGAPLYNIIASVPTESENICGDSFQIFSGYADIMSVEELKLIGINVPRGFISRFMDMEELSECFRVLVAAAETVPKPAVGLIETPSGVEMREIAQPPKRRMIIRKKGRTPSKT